MFLKKFGANVAGAPVTNLHILLPDLEEIYLRTAEFSLENFPMLTSLHLFGRSLLQVPPTPNFTLKKLVL